jgi:CHAT domain-containing protein
LPSALKEARDAVRLFPGATLLTGGDATAGNLMKQIARADLLHFAAHAITDPWTPSLSGLLVAPEEGMEGRVDFLTAARIRRSRLKARLVTLSACETAGGRLSAREGPVSLARAFLEAGAGAVLASRWPVDDDCTRFLMGHLYALLGEGITPAAALAAARSALEKERGGTWSHPFFSMSFFLYDRHPVPEN